MKLKEPKYIAVLVPPAKKLSPSNYISATDHIVERLKLHPLMQHGIPDPYPKLEDLIRVNTEHKTYYQGGLNGDRIYKFKRDVSRQTSQKMYSDMAAFLTALADGDPNKLQDTGYEVRFSGVRQTATYNPLLPPFNPTVKHAGEEGVLILSCGRVPGVGSIEVMMTLDPSDENSWQDCIKSSNCSHLQVKGLQPGQKYYFRIRYIGATGAGPWCEPVSLICL